jgi:L-ascorbate metabolism protein UlaG (beta-lactamase superfamily)
MHIYYFGLSSLKIQTKDAMVISDPFDKKSGLTPPRGNADILILAEKTNPLYSAISGISGEPFQVFDPGEYDIKGVTITGIPLKQGDHYVTAYLIESEDLKILNLGHIKEFSMKEDEVEGLGEIDILVLPVGGNTVLDASTATKVVNEIEPKLVIPTHYHSTGLALTAGKLETFIKEMGGKCETMDKLLIKKKDLDPDQTKVIILEPLR